MRTSRILSGVSAGVLLALAGGAQAAHDTANFSVTANVVANCTVDGDDMDFGDFDGVDDLDRRRRHHRELHERHPYTIALDVGHRRRHVSPTAR